MIAKYYRHTSFNVKHNLTVEKNFVFNQMNFK